VFHALICSKREKSRGPTEKRPGSTTPRMGTAEKAASSRGVRGDRGPTRCSMSRWLNVVDGVKGSSGRGDMAAPQVRAASVTALWGWQPRIATATTRDLRKHSAPKAVTLL